MVSIKNKTDQQNSKRKIFAWILFFILVLIYFHYYYKPNKK